MPFLPVEPLSPTVEVLTLVLKIALVPLTALAFLLQLHQQRQRHAETQPANTIFVLSVSPAQQSPRALAHARAIAHHTRYRPVFVAEPPFADDIGVATHALPPPPPQPTRRTALVLLERLLGGVMSLVRALDATHARHPDLAAVLINVPPSLPTVLAVRVWLLFRAPGAKLLVDWHNTASSILAANGVHPHIVGIAELMERMCAAFADAHWAVTKALADDLRRGAAVVPDAPPDSMRPMQRDSSGMRIDDPQKAHQLLQRIASAAGAARAYPAGETALTCGSGSRWQSDPDHLVVSSTSWTPDEDFEPLLDALCDIDGRLTNRRILLVVTGRGPLRADFESEVAKLKLQRVLVWCGWLSREDYAQLLASADIGVSMHHSSSGLDLPMKAVDMLGCGVPVISRNYRCVGELIRDGENGLLFDDAAQLANALVRTLVEPDAHLLLRRLRSGAMSSFDDSRRWLPAWKERALPSLRQVLSPAPGR